MGTMKEMRHVYENTRVEKRNTPPKLRGGLTVILMRAPSTLLGAGARATYYVGA